MLVRSYEILQEIGADAGQGGDRAGRMAEPAALPILPQVVKWDAPPMMLNNCTLGTKARYFSSEIK